MVEAGFCMMNQVNDQIGITLLCMNSNSSSTIWLSEWNEPKLKRVFGTNEY